jgi:hypothetical protein
MIKIEHVEVFGWEAAVRGMRSPMNSWEKSDSGWCHGDIKYCDGCPHFFEVNERGAWCTSDENEFVIGENDLKLMKSLSKAGSDHAKFLRMINVTFDLTAPLYFLKEWDTYKIGTVSNSCSTMHKIHAKEFEWSDFSYEHLMRYADCHNRKLIFEPPKELMARTIETLNYFRDLYIRTKDKDYWWQMIQLLPSSYNQKRTVQLNYQVLKSMYFARKEHKLDEWREFCKWCETLPYFMEVCVDA